MFASAAGRTQPARPRSGTNSRSNSRKWAAFQRQSGLRDRQVQRFGGSFFLEPLIIPGQKMERLRGKQADRRQARKGVLAARSPRRTNLAFLHARPVHVPATSGSSRSLRMSSAGLLRCAAIPEAFTSGDDSRFIANAGVPASTCCVVLKPADTNAPADPAQARRRPRSFSRASADDPGPARPRRDPAFASTTSVTPRTTTSSRATEADRTAHERWASGRRRRLPAI